MATTFPLPGKGKREFRSSKGSASIAAIGERRTDLDVEHVVPQVHVRQLETEWSDFLLACRNCKRRKWHNNTSRDGYLWPDVDDTFNAFTYRSGGRVSVAEELEPDERTKANELFGLVGLGAPVTDSDRRRHKKRQAWDKAKEIRDSANVDDKWRWVNDVAVATGFFSVWMTVFRDDVDMCRKLKQAFPGTRLKAVFQPRI